MSNAILTIAYTPSLLTIHLMKRKAWNMDVI